MERKYPNMFSPITIGARGRWPGLIYKNRIVGADVTVMGEKGTVKGLEKQKPPVRGEESEDSEEESDTSESSQTSSEGAKE